MEILPRCSRVSTTVWLHQLDSNEMLDGNYKRCNCLEKILEAVPHKPATVWPLTSHQKNQERKARQARPCWRSKNKLINHVVPSTRISLTLSHQPVHCINKVEFLFSQFVASLVRSWKKKGGWGALISRPPQTYICLMGWPAISLFFFFLVLKHW